MTSRHDCELRFVKRNLRINLCKRIEAQLWSYCTVWDKHPRMHMFFCSRAAIEYEKKRHASNRGFYVFHPFSKVTWLVNRLSYVCWIICVFVDPWIASYDEGRLLLEHTFLYYINLAINLFLLATCVIRFAIGYVDAKTSEVVLEQKLIAKKYLLTYFFFDLIGAFPLPYVLATLMNYRDTYVISACQWLRTIRYVRVVTILTLTKEYVYSTKVDLSTYCLGIATFMVSNELNFCVCLLYFTAYVMTKRFHLKESTWLHHSDEKTSYEMYVRSMHVCMELFFKLGAHRDDMNNDIDYTVGVIVMLTGYMTSVVILSFMFVTLNASNVSQSNYSQLTHQASSYVMINRVSDNIHKRLLAYYKAVYKKRYFHTDEIYSTLSSSIKQQLNMHDCRKLSHNIHMFEDLPKHVIERILLKSKVEYYLTNDILYSFNSLVESLFFISYGTVAIYVKQDLMEWRHYIDGDTVGEMAYVKDGESMTIAVAVETCEIMVIDRDDFTEICETYKPLKERIYESAQRKHRSFSVWFGKDKQCQREVLQELTKCLEPKIIRDANDLLTK